MSNRMMGLIHEHGIGGFARRARLYATRKARLVWWDWRHNVRTRDLMLTVKDQSGPSAAHAMYYEACDSNLLPQLLGELKTDFSKYVFVDIGTGMGKPLFIAATHPFKKIIGIEMSPMLVEAGRKNCGNFKSASQRCKDIEIVCEDAIKYNFPRDPLVVYMYNPFHEPIMRPFIVNLVDSIRRHPREVIIVYLNPRQAHVIEETKAFETVSKGTDESDYRRLRYAVWRHRASDPVPPVV
jgi:Putative methyltransferase